MIKKQRKNTVSITVRSICTVLSCIFSYLWHALVTATEHDLFAQKTQRQVDARR